MDAEVERRVVHASGGLVPLAFVADLLTYVQLQTVFLAGSLLALVLEALRLSGTIDLAVFDRLTREYEQEGLAGYALYVLSITATLWLFRPEAAVPGALLLAFVDPVAGLLGSGELRRMKQTFVLLATFGLSTLVALVFVPSMPAILGGVAATLADGVKPVVAGYVVDDNLTIPPAAAAAITVGLWLV
ncbi:dolichol kinase [Halorarius litoreus]|uniref:dolichol kinase n=1 Tax=Halorarius litoreus TaxID=2962676 RepID=UPI0020CDB371|nr:dolichol kinase [Halorarius litoreus]